MSQSRERHRTYTQGEINIYNGLVHFDRFMHLLPSIPGKTRIERVTTLLDMRDSEDRSACYEVRTETGLPIAVTISPALFSGRIDTSVHIPFGVRKFDASESVFYDQMLRVFARANQKVLPRNVTYQSVDLRFEEFLTAVYQGRIYDPSEVGREIDRIMELAAAQEPMIAAWESWRDHPTDRFLGKEIPISF